MTAWRCRHGWHDWVFVDYADKWWEMAATFSGKSMGSLTRECRRCELRLITASPRPRRIKVR